MLPVDKQVTSPEFAEKLKQLGCPQDSLFYWHLHARNKKYDLKMNPLYGITGLTKTRLDLREALSAYTSSELGMFLPLGFRLIRASPNIFEVNCSAWNWKEHEYFWNHTEVDCKALMLIKLIEDGTIKVSDLT